MEEVKSFGPTGRFPRGKLEKHDEGELQMGIAIDPREGIIKVIFGKPVVWLGLDADTAEALANNLLEKAEELRKGVQ